MMRKECTSVSCFLLCIAIIVPALTEAAGNQFGIESDNPYVVSREEVDGDVRETVIVPGRPPEFYRAPVAVPPTPDVMMGTTPSPVCLPSTGAAGARQHPRR